MTTRAQVINCRRLIGTIERHGALWRLIDSRLLNSLNVSFIHVTGSVTVDLFSNAFCVSLWNPNRTSILRWAALSYGGKMFRSLTTISNAFIKGRYRISVENVINEGVGHIPLNLFYDYSQIRYILLATISDSKSRSLVKGWTDWVTVPDEIIPEIE